jgi:hypothetical protein
MLLLNLTSQLPLLYQIPAMLLPKSALKPPVALWLPMAVSLDLSPSNRAPSPTGLPSDPLNFLLSPALDTLGTSGTLAASLEPLARALSSSSSSGLGHIVYPALATCLYQKFPVL